MATTSNQKWISDTAHSELTFRVKHMMISNVKGSFKSFHAEVDGDDLFNSSIKVIIDAASIYTSDEKRDTHLKSADFFDAGKYKEITFESSSFKKIEEDKYLLKGMLTIRNVSKEVSLDVEFGGIGKDPWGNERAGFSVSGRINRKDWGLNWNAALETGGVLVSEDVTIGCDIEFIRQK